MKASLTYLVIACGCGHVPEARAQAVQTPSQCMMMVAGHDGRNVEAERVAYTLQAQGCTAGSILRLTDIQPGHDVTNGVLVGVGNYYRELLCKDGPFTTEGPPRGVQTVTCTYNGSDAKPAG